MKNNHKEYMFPTSFVKTAFASVPYNMFVVTAFEMILHIIMIICLEMFTKLPWK